MNAVIGILPSNCNIPREIKILNLAGFIEDDIYFVTQEKKIKSLVASELTYLRNKYMLLAIAIWLIISYSIFGLLTNWFESKLIDVNEVLNTTTIVFITLFGSTVSAMIGLITGKAKCTKDLTLFLKRFRQGDSVIEVYTPHHREIDKAQRILEHGCATCVRRLQERSVETR